MDAVVDYERLDLPEGVAAAAASFLSMLLSLLLAVVTLGSAGGDSPTLSDIGAVLLIGGMYAGPIWLVGFLVIGLPAAAWIERRTPMGASWGRRFGSYAVAGLLVGGLLFLLHPLFLPAVVGSALGGRAGVELWRRWDARHEGAAARS